MSDVKLPEKVTRFLDRARSGGLEVSEPSISEFINGCSWAISSPLVHESRELWVYWRPGKRGGRMVLYRYDPHRGKKSYSETLTVRRAYSWVTLLCEDVERARKSREERGLA